MSKTIIISKNVCENLRKLPEEIAYALFHELYMDSNLPMNNLNAVFNNIRAGMIIEVDSTLNMFRVKNREESEKLHNIFK